MAGGTFDKTGKIRPGTYLNFKSSRNASLGTSRRGVVLLPLTEHSYGPSKEFISIYSSAPDAEKERLGYSIYDDSPSMLLIREALKNATEVKVYVINNGQAAKVTEGDLTATAKYPGTRGNALRLTIAANPEEGFDVSVYLDTDLVEEFEGVKTIAELAAKGSAWVDFTGEGDLSAASGLNLTGGTTTAATNSDITTFLDESEGETWNTLAFPVTGNGVSTLNEAVKSKIQYLREGVGKYRKAVMYNYAADYEGIINVTNSVELTDGTKLTAAQATAWVAGADAGASHTESLTYKRYEGAVGVVDVKPHADAEAAIKNGEFFFSVSEQGDVVAEYDINSLVTIGEDKDESYRKNRVIRVHDTFAENIILNFPPNKFDNNETGWDIMEGIGRTLLKQFEDDGAIKNVSLDDDFQVDRGSSEGDSTYFNIGLEAADSAEKLYFTISTR